MAQFYNALLVIDVLVVALTETWLEPSISSSEFFTDEYVVFRSDRNYLASNRSRGGGVLIAVNNCLTSYYIALNNYQAFKELALIDILVVKIVSSCSSLFLINVYIPPATRVAEYASFFEAIESLDFLYGHNIIILGDFNISNYAAHLQNSENDITVSMLTFQKYLILLNRISSIMNIINFLT